MLFGICASGIVRMWTHWREEYCNSTLPNSFRRTVYSAIYTQSRELCDFLLAILSESVASKLANSLTVNSNKLWRTIVLLINCIP